jgi:hypothetical protein
MYIFLYFYSLTLQQKVSLYVKWFHWILSEFINYTYKWFHWILSEFTNYTYKWFHWILSEFTNYNEWGPVKKQWIQYSSEHGPVTAPTFCSSAKWSI